MTADRKPVLLSCPFCGSAKIAFGYVRDGVTCGCRDCGAQVTAFQPEATRKAMDAWNTRAADPTRPAALELLEALKPFAGAARRMRLAEIPAAVNIFGQPAAFRPGEHNSVGTAAHFARALSAITRAEEEMGDAADHLGWGKPEAEQDDGVISVVAFHSDKRRMVSFMLRPDHVLITETTLSEGSKQQRLYVDQTPGTGINPTHDR